jgi:HSP20 family molecular chaperone IbpA
MRRASRRTARTEGIIGIIGEKKARELGAWPRWFAEEAFLPAMDVSDDDQHYVITVELAGTRKDDVHVDLHEGMLTIRGEKIPRFS